MDKFLESVKFRHTCKLFNGNKIPTQQFNNLLEVGRLSPSSFGMEPTRMVVVRSQSEKEKLQPLCWNQLQISTASEVIIYKSLVSDLNVPSAYLERLGRRRAATQEQLQGLFGALSSHLKARGYVGQNVFEWGALQAYIMATYMVAYASFLGIDTCYIEGFDKKGVEEYLGLNTQKEQVALIVCFGYRAKPQGTHFRLDLEELVSYK